jgi:hypothetical protein
MDHKLSQTAVGVVTTFIITLLLQWVMSGLTSESGSIITGPVVQYQGNAFHAFDVTNYSHRTIDGLKVVVPTAVDLSQITSSIPLNITEEKTGGNANLKRVRFSGFPPESVTRILLQQEGKIENARELGFSLSDPSDVSSPTRAGVIRVIALALSFAIVVGMAMWWLINIEEKAQKQCLEELENREKEIHDLQNQVGDIRNEMKRAKTAAARVRVFLGARLRDHIKELDFWRDTLRKILSDHSSQMAEKMIRTITESLGTYGTRAISEVTYDSMIALADVIARADRADV